MHVFTEGGLNIILKCFMIAIGDMRLPNYEELIINHLLV